MKNVGIRGVTLTELVIVVAISGTLMGMAGFTLQDVHERNDAENQIRQMYRDMTNARVRALQGRRAHFVTVTADGYQITEDTNESGGSAPDRGDMALWTLPKQFKFPSKWSGTVIMDANGLMSNSTDPPLTEVALDIRFDADSIHPECDCISLGPTRIREGIWDGMKCVEG